ncbi:MAG: cytochrome c [Amylibacter sp.]|nr:cytochrome c [Amylibacter sp.]
MIEICFLKLNHKFLYGCKLNLFAIGLYLILSLNNQTYANISLMPNNSETITFGKDIYLQECASCHGKNLAGQANWRERDDKGYMPAPPHDKNGHTWHHSDHNLFLTTKYGIEKIIGKKYPNNMPAYEDMLSDYEIIAVLSYIKSTWPSYIQI